MKKYRSIITLLWQEFPTASKLVLIGLYVLCALIPHRAFVLGFQLQLLSFTVLRRYRDQGDPLQEKWAALQLPTTVLQRSLFLYVTGWNVFLSILYLAVQQLALFGEDRSPISIPLLVLMMTFVMSIQWLMIPTFVKNLQKESKGLIEAPRTVGVVFVLVYMLGLALVTCGVLLEHSPFATVPLILLAILILLIFANSIWKFWGTASH